MLCIEDLMMKNSKIKTERMISEHSMLMSGVLMLQRSIRLMRHKGREARRSTQKNAAEVQQMKSILATVRQKERYDLKNLEEDLIKQLDMKKSNVDKCSTQYEIIRASKNVTAGLLLSQIAIRDEFTTKIQSACEELKSMESLLLRTKAEIQKEQVARFQVENACRSLKKEMNKTHVRWRESCSRFAAQTMENTNLKRACAQISKQNSNSMKFLVDLQDQTSRRKTEVENLSNRSGDLNIELEKNLTSNNDLKRRLQNIEVVEKNLTSCKNELTRQIHLKNETIKQFQGLSHMQSEKELRYQSNLIKSNPTESVNEIYTNGSINNVGSENKFDETIGKINQYEQKLDAKEDDCIQNFDKIINLEHELQKCRQKEDLMKPYRPLKAVATKLLHKIENQNDFERQLKVENSLLKIKIQKLQQMACNGQNNLESMIIEYDKNFDDIENSKDFCNNIEKAVSCSEKMTKMAKIKNSNSKKDCSLILNNKLAFNHSSRPFMPRKHLRNSEKMRAVNI